MGCSVISNGCLCGHYRLVNCRLSKRGTGHSGLVANAHCLGVRKVLPFRGVITSCMGRANGRILCQIAPIFRRSGLLTDNIRVRNCSIRSKNRNVYFRVCTCGTRPNVTVSCTAKTDGLKSALLARADNRMTACVLGVGAGGFRLPAYNKTISVGTRGGRRILRSQRDLLTRKCTPYNVYRPWAYRAHQTVYSTHFYIRGYTEGTLSL